MMISQAKLRDIDKLYEIEECLFLKEEGRFSKRVFLYHLKYPNRIFILWEKDQIIGYVFLLSHTQSLRIYSLAILPKFQGRGYGEKLCRFGIEQARKTQKKFIYLEVLATNEKAIGLYKKLGFIPKKILPKYYGFQDGLRMQKTL